MARILSIGLILGLIFFAVPCFGQEAEKPICTTQEDCLTEAVQRIKDNEALVKRIDEAQEEIKKLQQEIKKAKEQIENFKLKYASLTFELDLYKRHVEQSIQKKLMGGKP